MIKKSVSGVVKVFTLLLSLLLLATVTVGAASACSSDERSCDKQCSYDNDSICSSQCFVYFTAICDDNKCSEDDNKCSEDDNKCSEDDNKCSEDDNKCEVNHCEKHGEHHDRCDYHCKDRCKEHGDRHDRCDDRCRDRC